MSLPQSPDFVYIVPTKHMLGKCYHTSYLIYQLNYSFSSCPLSFPLVKDKFLILKDKNPVETCPFFSFLFLYC